MQLHRHILLARLALRETGDSGGGDAADSYLAYGHYLQGVGALVVEGVGVDVVGDQELGRL